MTASGLQLSPAGALAQRPIGSNAAERRLPFEFDPETDLERAPTVLIVDAVDVNRRVLRGMLKVNRYRLLEARRPAEAFALIECESVDLIIVDLMMPEMGGTDFCARVKSQRRTQLIPILMLTNVPGAESEVAGISAGADEFVTRPFHPEVVRTRVRSMLRNKAAIDSLEEAETILFALAQSVEGRDQYTGDHCGRLARYSMALGTAMGLPKPQLLALYRGGFLHDIGKICVPDAVLFKKGPLTEEEWVVMRAHAVKGEAICKPMKTLAPVLPIIRNHHERWDGTGYPDGLRGEETPLLARILQVADIYDALTTARPYKPALQDQDAFQIMYEEVRKGWRDPELIPLFRECLRKQELWDSLTEQGTGVDNFQRSLDAMRKFLEA